MNLQPCPAERSALGRRDPRLKLVALALYAVVVAAMQRPAALAAALALAGALAAGGRLRAGAVLRRLVVVNGFVAVLWLFLPLTHPGPAVARWGPWVLSGTGIGYATAITVRANAILLATMALLGTSSVFDLVHALHHLRAPDKLTQVAFFTLRYVEVIRREAARLRAAMRVRCFRPRTSLHTYRTMAYMVGMLLVRSFERSERVYHAMLCRGYRGTFPVYRHFAMTGADWALGLAVLLAVLGLAALEWGRLLC